MAGQSVTHINKNDTARIDHVEKNVDQLGKSVVKLETTVSGLDVRLGGVEGQMTSANAGINQLLQRGSGYEATKGMVPVTTITWAVGTLLTLVTISFTMLMFFSSSIKEEILDKSELNNKQYQMSVEDRNDLRKQLRETQDKALINETKAAERYSQQRYWNEEKSEWNRRIVDRQLAEMSDVSDEFRAIRDILATKASVKELHDIQRDHQKQISVLRENAAAYLADLRYVQLLQNRMFPTILENAENNGELNARIRQAEEDLDKTWPQLLEASNKLGMLDPIIDGLGLTLPIGNESRLNVVEKLIDAIDKEGSRGTNLRLNK